jgi:hypothetical protein
MILRMTFTDVAVVLSFLAIVMVVAKMVRALRLLEARVTLLQEQVERNHGAVQKVAARPLASRPPSRTPVVGVPVTSAIPRSPSPDLRPPDDAKPRADPAEPTDDEIAWAWLEQEQARLKKAMGRDFQARKNPRSPGEVRGNPTGPRVLSAREVAAKLERK